MENKKPFVPIIIRKRRAATGADSSPPPVGQMGNLSLTAIPRSALTPATGRKILPPTPPTAIKRSRKMAPAASRETPEDAQIAGPSSGGSGNGIGAAGANTKAAVYGPRPLPPSPLFPPQVYECIGGTWELTPPPVVVPNAKTKGILRYRDPNQEYEAGIWSQNRPVRVVRFADKHRTRFYEKETLASESDASDNGSENEERVQRLDEEMDQDFHTGHSESELDLNGEAFEEEVEEDEDGYEEYIEVTSPLSPEEKEEPRNVDVKVNQDLAPTIPATTATTLPVDKESIKELEAPLSEAESPLTASPQPEPTNTDENKDMMTAEELSAGFKMLAESPRCMQLLVELWTSEGIIETFQKKIDMSGEESKQRIYGAFEKERLRRIAHMKQHPEDRDLDPDLPSSPITDLKWMKTYWQKQQMYLSTQQKQVNLFTQ